MPRIARIVATGFPYHIIQRSNRRQKIFFAKQTRKKYLELLKEYSQKWFGSILAYCLMTNHVHLLIKPLQSESLSKIMQGVSLCYTQFSNKRYKKTGRLWESRYYSSVIDEEPYLWAVARYIEQNPVRAGLVKHPEDYPYSSARAHITGAKNDILTEPLFDEADLLEYVKFVKEPADDKELKSIRNATRGGHPLGDEGFVNKIGELLGVDFKKIVSAKADK
ncbi:MAG: transposase [Candidatus Brocadiia bacterium]